MNISITKAEFRSLLGPDAADADIARFFRISSAAVAQWGDAEPIPEKRALQARLLRPDLFGPPPSQVAAEPVRAVS